MPYIVSVDCGGTFSDCVIVDISGRVFTGKAPSTPEDYSLGVIDSVAVASELMDLSLLMVLQDATLFLNGTTVATNCMLTRSGARVGLITTRGHEDALLIGRTFQKVAGLPESEVINIARLQKAEPIVPRSLIRGVTERVDYKGAVVVPLNKEEVREAVTELSSRGVECFAVSFLWSFMNPEHERQAKSIIDRMLPDAPTSISSEIAPVIKEYERAATTVMNAYLHKATSRYISALERRLGDCKFGGMSLIMHSAGGVLAPHEAAKKAVALLRSGPAGGVLASSALAKLLGHKNVITADVGGTSFDVGLIFKDEIQYSRNPVFSQYQLVLPVVDVSSIGAGGGSIAWLEGETRVLRVGPRSAGAEPGPVCYNTGGLEPTVTDANLILNRLNSRYFLGGRRPLHREKAIQAVEERIARPLGMSVEEAAMGIIEIIDASMANLVRRMTVSRGYDPREFVLYVFGGAGPLHVGGFIQGVGVKEAVIPAHASEFSAYGIAGADIVHVSQTSAPMVAPLDPDELNRIFTNLEQRVTQDLRRNGVGPENMSFRRFIDMRYRGQVHEVRVPVPSAVFGTSDPEWILSEFESRYEMKYGRGTAYKEAGVEARTFEVRGEGIILKPAVQRYSLAGQDPCQALKEERLVYFKECSGFCPTPIYERGLLNPGNVIIGPAVVEAPDTTVLVHPGQVLRIDEYLNCILGYR